jgi:hypothetical protein
MEADFPIHSLMRATCSSLIRVERPDGSSTEIQDCQLSDEPVMIAAFQGVPPRQAFLLESGPCEWHSDYWFAVADLDVMASSANITVTPSGHVHVRSEYPAAPLGASDRDGSIWPKRRSRRLRAVRRRARRASASGA